MLALFREEEDEDEGPENGHTSWRREGIIPSLYYMVSFSRLAGLKAFVRSRFLVLLVCLLNVV
jgi:hypothetical protein